MPVDGSAVERYFSMVRGTLHATKRGRTREVFEATNIYAEAQGIVVGDEIVKPK